MSRGMYWADRGLVAASTRPNLKRNAWCIVLAFAVVAVLSVVTL